MFAYWKKHNNALIVGGILLGVLCGGILNSLGVPTASSVEELAKGDSLTAGQYCAWTFSHLLDLTAEVFLRALKMVVIPVILTSVIYGIAGISAGANVGRIAWKTVAYYFTTTGIAVLIGLCLVNTIKPGEGPAIREDSRKILSEGGGGSSQDALKKIKTFRAQQDEFELETKLGTGGKLFLSMKGLIRDLIPGNLFEALSKGSFLPIIVFALIFGSALLRVRDRHPELLRIVEQLQNVFFQILHAILLTAPLGFFSAVCWLIWTTGFGAMRNLLPYGMAVCIGLLVHGCIVLPLICKFLGRRNPWTYARQVNEALIMAFSTASSSATLPTSLNSAEKKAGIKKEYASFVLPLGSTVNMDGTAIYESVAIVFLIQVLGANSGIPLDFASQSVIFISVTLAAIGAAGIPGAGIFMLLMMMTVQGVPLELIGLILILDRPLDMLRTCVNVWGDLVGCAVISHSEEKAAKLQNT